MPGSFSTSHSCRALAASHRRLRPVDRRQHPWRDRSGAPVPLQRHLCPTQRHRTDSCGRPINSGISCRAREIANATLHCTASHRDDSGACTHPPQELTGPPKSQWRRRNGSTPDPQTPTLRRRLPRHAHRRERPQHYPGVTSPPIDKRRTYTSVVVARLDSLKSPDTVPS